MSTLSINNDNITNINGESVEDKDVAYLKKKTERKLSGIRERYSSKYASNAIPTSLNNSQNSNNNNSNGNIGNNNNLYNIDSSFLPSYSTQPFFGSSFPPEFDVIRNSNSNNNNLNNNIGNPITSEEEEEEEDSDEDSDDSVEIVNKESLLKLNQSTQNNLDELQNLIQNLLGDSKSPDKLSENEYLQYQQMVEQQEQLERERRFLQEFEKEQLLLLQQQEIQKEKEMKLAYEDKLREEEEEEESLSSGDSSLLNSMNDPTRDHSTSKTPLIDIGLEYKYRVKLEKDPKDYRAMVKWGNLIVKKIKEQLGGYDIDVCLLDWNEDLIPIPSQSTQSPPNTPFTDSLQSYLLKEPLFDACSKYQHALQLSGGSNTIISFSSLLNFSISNNILNSSTTINNNESQSTESNSTNNNNNNNNSNNNISTKPKSGTINRMLRAVSLPPPPPTPGTEDPNSPWSDFNLWLKWGDCLFLLCTYLELPMYKSTCEKYYKCVLLLQKQQIQQNNDENKKTLSSVLRKWGITLSRYSRRMKCQFLMSEWSNEENIQVEELWKILHSQSVQSLSYSQYIYPSQLTTYHLATSFLRHAVTLNQFGGNRAQIYGLVVKSCELYKQCLLDPEEFYSSENLLKSSNENLTTSTTSTNSNNTNTNNNINNNNNNNNNQNSNLSFNDVEILNELQYARAIENWGRALDIQLTVKLNEDESMEKEEEDLHAVDEYLSTFSKVIMRGIVPSLEGIVNLCLNSRQAIQYKAINSLSVLCRSKEVLSLSIYDELLEHMAKVESFVFKRDDAESLLSQQRTLKSMPPKLQAYVRMSGLTEDEIMKNFEIAWNSIYFLTKDTIPNQPVPPNYYRSNKKNKKNAMNSSTGSNNSLNSSSNQIVGDSREPIIPSLHRSNINNLIITPYTENSPEPKFMSLKPHATLNFKKHTITTTQSKLTIEPRSSSLISSINSSSSSNSTNNYNNYMISSLNSSMSNNNNNQWLITVPVKKPTRRATISQINKLQEDEYLQAKLKNNICISQYLPNDIKRSTVKPPPLDRCDESIFSSGNPLTLFRDKVKLGTGAFGNVFYAIRKQDSKPIAIKVLMERTKKGSPIIPELYIHSACNHPNVVSYYESYLCKGHLWIIMEYCDGGTVRDLIQDDWKNNQQLITPQPLEEALIAFVTKQLLEGLIYLRSKGIIHRDIKSRNILLTRRGKVKIADFGLATCCSLGRGRTRMCGTMGRIAPEIVRREPYDTQADVYSLGCLLVELAEGMVPYGKDSSLKALFYTAIYDYKLSNASKYSPEFVDFLNLCLLSDPFIRPTPEMLLQHQFFQIHSHEKGKQILMEKFKGQDNRKNMILENFVPF